MPALITLKGSTSPQRGRTTTALAPPTLALGLALFGVGTLGSIMWIEGLSNGNLVLLALAPQAAGCLALGWTIRELGWTMGALAFVPVLLALPFGNADSIFTEGPPIAFLEFILIPATFGLLLAGFASQRHFQRRRSP